MCNVIRKVYQENIPFVKTIDMYVFIKGIIGKTNCYLCVLFSSICIKLVNIKNNFEHVLFPLFIKSEKRKIILKNWIVGRQEDHSQTIKKNRF